MGRPGTVSVTATLPRVAFEYGQLSCARAMSSAACARSIACFEVECDRETKAALAFRADADARGYARAGEVELLSGGDARQAEQAE